MSTAGSRRWGGGAASPRLSEPEAGAGGVELVGQLAVGILFAQIVQRALDLVAQAGVARLCGELPQRLVEVEALVVLAPREQRLDRARVAAEAEADQRLLVRVFVGVPEPGGERLAQRRRVALDLRPQSERRPVAHVGVLVARQLDQRLDRAVVVFSEQVARDGEAHVLVSVVAQFDERLDAPRVLEMPERRADRIEHLDVLLVLEHAQQQVGGRPARRPVYSSPVRLKAAATLVLALACSLALGACGGGGDDKKPTATQSSTPAATTTATTPSQAGTRTLTIDETATLTLARKISLTHYIQKGRATGTFPGTITLDAQLGSKGVVAKFTAQLPGGSVSGTALATLQIVGRKLDPISGTAQITGGTGRFAHAHATGLKVSGGAALDGSKSVLRLRGSGTY
jgi:hypothetical protein